MRRALTTTPTGLSPPPSPSTTRITKLSPARSSPARGLIVAPAARLSFGQPTPVGPAHPTSSTLRSARFASSSTQFNMTTHRSAVLVGKEGEAGSSEGPAVESQRSSAGGLSQIEMDSLVEGISFDDDLSFDLTPSPSHTPQRARTGLPSRRSSPSSPPATTADPAAASTSTPYTRTTPTKRKSAILECITLSPSPPPSAVRTYSSASRRLRDEDDDPLPAPPPDNPALLAHVTSLVGDLHDKAFDDVLELSDSSVDLPPVSRLIDRRGKENIKPGPETSAEVKVTSRTFYSNPAAPARPGNWLAERAASELARSSSAKDASSSRPVPPLIASARRATESVTAGQRPMSARAVARAKGSTRAARDREKQAQLKLIHPEFKFDEYAQKPRLVYSVDEEEIARELRQMKGPLGFDIEWEPYTLRGQGPTALAQVCDERTILLIHVAKMPHFSPSLRALCEDPARIKLGVQIAGDAQKLIRDGFVSHPQGMLELNRVAKAVDATHHATNSYGLVGLQALVAKYLSKHLLKEGNVRKGKWAASLGEAQKNYAANDVYSSLLVHLHLKRLAPEGVDVEAFATEFGHAPTNAEGSTTPTNTAPRPRPTPAGPPGVTPRQLEAYRLLHDERLPLAAATKQMCTTRPIKPLSVVWSFLGALNNSRPPLRYDPAMVLATVDAVKGASKATMVEEFETLLARITEEKSL